jgi:cell division protein ZapA
MAQVSLQINGYGYTLGCADGEEEHLRALAADLDRRIDEIKVATGPSGEARLLLMAALLVSDELHDLREESGLRNGDAPPPPKPEPKAGRRLRGLAKRAEAIAESADGSPSATTPEPPTASTTEPPTAATSEPSTASPSVPPSEAPPSEPPSDTPPDPRS